MSEDNIVNTTLFDKFKVIKRLNNGSFGVVYLGQNLKTKDPLAIKMESKKENHNLLETEAYRLIYLKGEGIPTVFCYGSNKTHNILVIELLGKSLEELFNLCSRKFSLKTVCYIGIETIRRIQFIHEKNHIHRDIKPDNFMMGMNNNVDVLYLIDFGLAKKFRSGTKKQHISMKTNKSITGTARYCSMNTHKGYEQSRRDDLESIGYMLIYFLRGTLPWQGLKCKTDSDRYKKIFEKKFTTSEHELCDGLPLQFFDYIQYVRTLGFQSDPNYVYLLALFNEMLEKVCKIDPNEKFVYDWNEKYKLSFAIEGSLSHNPKKMNTSIAIGISKRSPMLYKDDSNIAQLRNDINNNSIFHKNNILGDGKSNHEQLKNDKKMSTMNINGSNSQNYIAEENKFVSKGSRKTITHLVKNDIVDEENEDLEEKVMNNAISNNEDLKNFNNPRVLSNNKEIHDSNKRKSKNSVSCRCLIF